MSAALPNWVMDRTSEYLLSPFPAGSHLMKRRSGPAPTSKVRPPNSFSHTARTEPPPATALTDSGISIRSLGVPSTSASLPSWFVGLVEIEPAQDLRPYGTPLSPKSSSAKPCGLTPISTKIWTDLKTWKNPEEGLEKSSGPQQNRPIRWGSRKFANGSIGASRK